MKDNFIRLHANAQFDLYCMLKMLSFFQCLLLASLSKNKGGYKSGGLYVHLISLVSVRFYDSTMLFSFV